MIAVLALLACLMGGAWAHGGAVVPDDYPWPLVAIGAGSLLIGLFLTFCGKRFFKPFLAVSGFIGGFILGICALLWAEPFYDGLLRSWWLLTPFVLGVILAMLCLWIIKMALTIAAAAGGFALGSSMISLFSLDIVGRVIFMAICILVAIVLVFVIEKLILCIASALIGAFVAVGGLDLFIKTGFLEACLQTVQAGAMTVVINWKVLAMAALFLGLASAGIITQLFVIKKAKKSVDSKA